jgi:type VI secretion system protein ImpK
LLSAANPLLMMLQTLRVASPPGNVVDLRGKLIDMVKDFDAACARYNVADMERNIANYALCAVIDECVQMTPWGGSASWAQQSLLIHFHRENWGGEKFFDILNRIAGTPAKYQQLLELFYVCLALGFMGRFHLEGPSGRQTVADLREKVFQLIRQGRSETDRTLATHWKGLEVAAKRFRGFGIAAATVVFLALACLGIFAFYYLSLGTGFDLLQLERLALPKVAPTPIAAAPAAKPRLAQLLSAEITNKQLQVRDLQLESVVTLLGEGMFDSASAVPSGSAGPLIDKVADALKQVEGNVLVTGHTDNVPTRTLRFASNWDLSKERAASVARLLSARLGDSARVSFEGRGDTEPLAKNDTPDGRSQNRRVEIVLKVADARQ